MYLCVFLKLTAILLWIASYQKRWINVAKIRQPESESYEPKKEMPSSLLKLGIN